MEQTSEQKQRLNSLPEGRYTDPQLLRHWHPVISSHKLGRKPVSVELCGQQLVVFRTKQNQIGVLLDRCCHRGMKLSRGWVEGDRLVCPYHGWSYDLNGQIYSPSTPNLKPCTQSFEAIENDGAVWIKAKGSNALFPDFQAEEYQYVCTQFFDIHAPLEVVLDNFTEMEHTPTTHHFFGHSHLADLETQVEVNDRTIQVRNQGSQRHVSLLASLLFGIKTDDLLLIDWDFHFSPVYSLAKSAWASKESGKTRDRWQLHIPTFFVPVNDRITRLVVFVFGKSSLGKLAFQMLIKPMVTLGTRYEMQLDRQMLEHLADMQMTPIQMQLGRFDKALVECRKHLVRLYLGQ